MRIDKEKCAGCGNCVPVCTMGVTPVIDGRGRVNETECVECGTCHRTLRDEGCSRTFLRIVR